MKERAIDCERTVVAHNQAPEVSQPSVGAFDNPSPLVPPQGSAVLGCGPDAIPLVRTDQFDTLLPQAFPQRIAVVRFVGDHPHRLLPRTARVMTPCYPDRRQRRLREFDFRRGCRVKVVSQRKTAAVDHHHPLRPLAPLGFSDSAAPFFAGAKLPSRNDSLHFNCWRWFNSLRNARQMLQPNAPLLPVSQPSPAGRRMREFLRQVLPASPAPQNATESLPALDDSESTDDHPGVVWATWGATGRSFSTALRSAMDQTAPFVLLRRCCPCLSPISDNSTIVISKACPRLCNSF